MRHRPAASLSVAVHNTDELKQSLLHVWHDVEQTIIDNAIDEWRRRLRACVTIFSHMTRGVSVFVKCDTSFRFFFVNYHKLELLTFVRYCGNITEGYGGKYYTGFWKISSLSVVKKKFKIR